jgi:hypothetical protein
VTSRTPEGATYSWDERFLECPDLHVGCGRVGLTAEDATDMIEPSKGRNRPRTRRSELERLVDRTELGPTHPELGTCWRFTGTTTPYGRIAKAQDSYTHRLGWKLLRGPIPDGMELHHRCGVHACWNPDHLEVVTHAENRAFDRKAICKHGHRLVGENVRIDPQTAEYARAALACERTSVAFGLQQAVARRAGGDLAVLLVLSGPTLNDCLTAQSSDRPILSLARVGARHIAGTGIHCQATTSGSTHAPEGGDVGRAMQRLSRRSESVVPRRHDRRRYEDPRLLYCSTFPTALRSL